MSLALPDEGFILVTHIFPQLKRTRQEIVETPE